VKATNMSSIALLFTISSCITWPEAFLATCFFWGIADSFWFSEGCFYSTDLHRAEAKDRSGIVYLEQKVLPDDPWFGMHWFFLRWSSSFAWLQTL
jgi:hypothetical protein